MDSSFALKTIPTGLRISLFNEYQSIVQNYSEHRWSPSELSGGKFCEIVYSILKGHSDGKYPAKPSKPRDFVAACRQLETNNKVPRSFQILIPRLLPPLYEIRNNRGVGHTGGDVDPNHMDATVVVSSCNWIISELIRVFHDLPIEEAQSLVDSLAERRTPLIWQKDDLKRILSTKLNLEEQILVLLSTEPTETLTSDLLRWTEYKNKTRFISKLKVMHSSRLVEYSELSGTIQILPPGANRASELLVKHG